MLKDGRNYRVFSGNLENIKSDNEEPSYTVEGRAIVFDTPTVLWECDGIEYKEIISRKALEGCDLSDVIFNYNHGGKVLARLRNKTLSLEERADGLYIRAYLGGTEEGKRMHEEISGGYIDRMSFSFGDFESDYDKNTHTRMITKIKKLYDVSAVDIPAYEATEIAARSSFSVEHDKEIKAMELAERRRRISIGLSL